MDDLTISISGVTPSPSALRLEPVESYKVRKVSVSFDETWSGLAVFAVFELFAGNIKVAVDDGVFYVPREVLASPGMHRMAFYGTSGSDSEYLIKSTSVAIVAPDSVRKEASATDPTPSEIQQMESSFAATLTAAKASETAAAASATEAAASATNSASSASAAAASATEAATAKTDAEAAANGAAAANDAKTAAQTAQSGAETAQGKAEDAQEAAEAAQAAAESAQASAETAETNAGNSASAASGSATAAAGSATDAEAAKTAAQAAQAAAEVASSAAVSAHNVSPTAHADNFAAKADKLTEGNYTKGNILIAGEGGIFADSGKGLSDIVQVTDKGMPNGVPSLGPNGVIPNSQLPVSASASNMMLSINTTI